MIDPRKLDRLTLKLSAVLSRLEEKRLKRLEDQTSRKKIVAHLTLDREMLRQVIRRKI